jgi:hypothetical protein
MQFITLILPFPTKIHKEQHKTIFLLSYECETWSLALREEYIENREYIEKSRDISGGIALGYGLDDRGSRVRFPEEAGNFSLHHRVQNGSGAHPASYPMGTRGSFPGGKAAGT